MEMIIQEYEILKKDRDYLKTKRRTAYMHEKLAFIKALIAAYDMKYGKHDRHSQKLLTS